MKKILSRFISAVLFFIKAVFIGSAVLAAVLCLLFWATGLYHTFSYRYTQQKNKPLGGMTYYVSPTGQDTRSGKSPADAWQTISRLNTVAFKPGDKILFEGGQTFAGTLLLDDEDLGTPDKPIRISSYGQGAATINAGLNDGISAENTAGLAISNVVITGSGASSNKGSGIRIVNKLWGNVTLDYLRIDSVDVSGFGRFGIGIQGEKWKSGFNDCQITYSSVHDNAEAGVYVLGVFEFISHLYAHRNFVIHHVLAYNNFGKSGPDIPNTGSGIVLSDLDKGLIERCVAHHNGKYCNSNQGGPVGIWVWDANDITIQFNESYANHTGGKKDGGGFDLDGGVTNSVMQYNYSHDNDGSGYLFAQFPFARKSENNTARYNISQNDGRKNNTAGIYFWGDFRNTYVYNNTVFVDRSGLSEPSVIKFEYNESAGPHQHYLPSNVTFFNNIFVTTSGLPMITQPYDIPTARFMNNNYYSPDSAIKIIWGKHTYRSLDDWRKEARQEIDKSTVLGFSENPHLVNAGKGEAINSADSLNKLHFYDLLPNSPMIDKGITPSAFSPLHMATVDFHGNRIPNRSKVDLGAVEFALK
jgi:hypothetical protein